MIQLNFPIILLAALVPLVVGFLWYNPKTFANAWMQASNINPDEQKKGHNMTMVFLITYIVSFLIAMSMNFVVIHQFHLYSILANETGLKDSNSELSLMVKDFMAKYGSNFRTFKHGAFHGTLLGFMVAMPIMTINALFEGKGFKYIAINSGYWMLTLALMGGIICAWG